MYVPAYTKQFAKDAKLAKRRGKNFEKLKLIVRSLVAGEELDPIHRDHKLIGEFAGRRECHIESDWLLVYTRTSSGNSCTNGHASDKLDRTRGDEAVFPGILAPWKPGIKTCAWIGARYP
jgi:mRNA interferase YafQ